MAVDILPLSSCFWDGLGLVGFDEMALLAVDN
jgi:hypothetical protein